MSKLDSRLRLRLMEARAEDGADAGLGGQQVGVFVDFTHDLKLLQQHGLKVESETSNIAVGTIELVDVEELAALDNVLFITMERTVRPHLKQSVPEIGADQVHTLGLTGYTGRGVVVGIIDTGIDFRHHSFRKSNGDTRILSLWDQTLPTQPGSPFNLGVVYSDQFIDNALNNGGPPVLQQDTDGHGTHVAGIAAGDGSQAGVGSDNCEGTDTYIGVAPEADLVIVKARSTDRDLNNAVSYIFQQAASKPAVINISLGQENGPHDGTDAFERFIDSQLQGTTGRVVVVSAGNHGHGALHASKNIQANQRETLTFTVAPGDRQINFFEIWYEGNARLEFTLQEPMGATIPFPVLPGAVLPPQGLRVIGHTVVVTSTLNSNFPRNNRHQISFNLTPPANGQIAAGPWIIRLRERAGHSTRVDCWIDFQSNDEYPSFIEADRDPNTTVGNPGAAHNVITVGSYDPDGGALANGTARGPTIDGRIKPDITAPGVGIFAPKSGARSVWYCCDCCLTFYVPLDGTSQATPHVTGVAALMLERNPGFSFDIIRAFIQGSARPPDDDPSPVLPNNEWGSGKIDALAAVLLTPVATGGGARGGGDVAATPMKPIIGSTTTLRSPQRSIPARLHEIQGVLLASPSGHLIAALVSTHFDEVYRLINTNRRVATIWNRNCGPVLVQEMFTLNGDFDALIPEMLGDSRLSEQLGRILGILSRYGSLALRRDIACYGPLIMATPGTRLKDLDYWKFVA